MAVLRTRRLSWGYHVVQREDDGTSVRGLWGSNLYTVPDGHVAIIRDIRLGTVTPTADGWVEFLLTPAAGGFSVRVWKAIPPAPTGSIGVSLDVALEAGDEVGIDSNLVETTWIITGALLPVLA